MTVMKDHAPLMTTLKPGVVTVAESAGKTSRLFVRGGFADVALTGLTILAESAVPVEQLDAAKIEAEMQDAREDLADAQDDETRRLAQEKLDQLAEVRGVLNV